MYPLVLLSLKLIFPSSKVESVQYPMFDRHHNDYILSTLTTILPTLTLISAGVLFPAQLLAITLTL